MKSPASKPPKRPPRAASAREVLHEVAARNKRVAGSVAPTLARLEPRKRPPEPAELIAYDFETTRIAPGTPRPVYLTAYALGLINLAERVRDMAHLHALIVNNFLTDELKGSKFVAWNANNFDTYFVAAALVTDERYVIRPYLTRSNSLRGMRVMLAGDVHKKNAKGWEFLDGIAMLGLMGVSLAKFLDNFAPDYKKLSDAIDFEREEFNPDNPKHRDYAMRDSVGLWYGITRAQSILMQRFDQPLAVTMGGACIKIFQRHIPEGVRVKSPEPELSDVIRGYVLRGGFCYCVRRYHGPVWKFDLNQAYAAAMREAALPCGEAWPLPGRMPKSGSSAYVAQITATNPRNRVPFYYRTSIDGRMRSMFGMHEIRDTWLTSVEIDQLQREGWQIEAAQSWFWQDSFSMREFVDKLENMRQTCEGGPAGPIGTMVKMTGNHSYGKTLEQVEPMEYALSLRPPAGFVPLYPEGDADPLPFVHVRALEPDEIRLKAYHQPQLGAWITAYVRMVVRRAALIDPEAWLYADTDCVVFSRDVGAKLDTHPSRYGAWKIEEQGAIFKIIAKKVYFDVHKISDPDPKVRAKAGHAKGLHVKKLTAQDFAEWFDGSPPAQDQIQRQNFLRVMQGVEMYRLQNRRGTAVEATIATTI